MATKEETKQQMDFSKYGETFKAFLNTGEDNIMTDTEALKTDYWRRIYEYVLNGANEDWLRTSLAGWTEDGRVDWDSNRTRFYFRVYYLSMLRKHLFNEAK